jgi:sugar lactone lactonase YvrE
MFSPLKIIGLAGSLIVLASCGGDGSSSSGGRTYTTQNNNVTTIAGAAGAPGSADGTGAAARFNNPFGITLDGANLYVADTYNNTIRKIVISTGAVTTIAGTAGPPGSADAIGAAASFFAPAGTTTDGANLYVTDYGNHTIRKIVISTGTVTTIAGAAGAMGSADGTGAAARFNKPSGITTDGANLYLADTYNSTIRKIVISTGAVTTIAGTAGAPGAADGTGAAATFSRPFGITTDGANLYVTDWDNHTIRKIVISTGAVTTIAGTAYVIGWADGTGAAALFYYPLGITTDGTNLFVADTDNHTIRKIVISTGVVTTIAGTAPLPGSADGTGAAARFNYPSGVTTDGTNLYVADTNNSTIRKIY